MKEARSFCTPCEYNGSVYLTGYGSDLIEVFNLETNSFLALTARLPEQYSACVVFVESSFLVVLSSNYVTRWNASDSQDLQQVTQASHTEISVYCSTIPIVLGGLVYIADRGKCYKVQIDGSEKVEVVSILG